METKKVRVIAPNHTDIVHPETDASVVLTTGGQTVQQVLDGLSTSSVFTSTKDGVVPASGGGTVNYLRADGTWVIPPDTVYVHPTTAGSIHIPAGGSAGQILRWTALGTAAWGADNDTTYSNATTSVSGLMSSTDKTKLDGVSTGANKTINHATNGSISVDGTEQVVYTHPASHPPSIITQDASNRFVTDTEKTTWNAKGTSNLVLGTTSTTAYRGDYGNTAYTHSQATHAPSDANNYTHPTTTGNKHIPSGGAENQLLRYSSDGTAEWYTFSGTQSTAGYQTLPNGLILQYGQFTHPGGTNYSALTFPLTFPTGCISLTGNFMVTAGGYDPSSTATWAAWCVAFHGVGTTGANVMIRAGDDNTAPSSSGLCYWLAVGY